MYPAADIFRPVDALLLQRKARVNTPQIYRREKCHPLHGIFHQTPKTHLGVTTLAHDYPKWMLSFDANLCLGFLDLANRFVQHTAFTMLL